MRFRPRPASGNRRNRFFGNSRKTGARRSASGGSITFIVSYLFFLRVSKNASRRESYLWKFHAIQPHEITQAVAERTSETQKRVGCGWEPSWVLPAGGPTWNKRKVTQTASVPTM